MARDSLGQQAWDKGPGRRRVLPSWSQRCQSQQRRARCGEAASLLPSRVCPSLHWECPGMRRAIH